MARRLPPSTASPRAASTLDDWTEALAQFLEHFPARTQAGVGYDATPAAVLSERCARGLRSSRSGVASVRKQISGIFAEMAPRRPVTQRVNNSSEIYLDFLADFARRGARLPMRFIRFLPSFCFSNNLRLRLILPPEHLANTFLRSGLTVSREMILAPIAA